jgi:hypothetical protein
MAVPITPGPSFHAGTPERLFTAPLTLLATLRHYCFTGFSAFHPLQGAISTWGVSFLVKLNPNGTILYSALLVPVT